MEIRDPIHGAIEINDKEVAVLESPAFQRLRAIKQLGFGEFSYPGATHNRYIHSLGVSHLAGEAFDIIFRGHQFVKKETKWRLRQALRLATLLHDIGHGPLSHTTEYVMPQLKDLKVNAYKGSKHKADRQATHEDFTIKFITDSPLADVLKREFPDLLPIHIACLIDPLIACPDDCFEDNGFNYRPILNQIASSEVDVDRMDYLVRDSYFCGTDYGRIEIKWLISNLSSHTVGKDVFLALSRRAIYTFDDFLISRHHMYLMVYFHHKAIIYDELLDRYLTSADCTYKLPSDIHEYLKFTDYHLYEHLKTSSNPWAKRISERRPFQMLFELHHTVESERPGKIKARLESEGVELIHSSSVARLSKYHASLGEQGLRIYVVDPYDKKEKPYPLEQSTEIFQMYEKNRNVDRIYVAPEQYKKASQILESL